MSQYEVHPLAELIPAMTDDEYAELRKDIEQNGLREPIMLYEGKILDGRHRARALRDLGLDVVGREYVREYDGDDPAKYVISLNVHRRHLTTSQRAEIALAALPHYKEQARRRQHEGQTRGAQTLPGQVNRKSHDEFRARDQAAADVGVSGITVARLERVAREAPDLHEEIKAGKTTVGKAWEQTRERAKSPAPAPANLTGKRRVNAEAQKRRIEELVGTCQAYERALHELRVEEAAAVANSKEVAGWIKCLKAGERSLRGVRERLKGVGLSEAA